MREELINASENTKLRTEGLQVSFGNVKILNNINMKVAEKKITSIVGQSGCGKSTLLKSLNRITEEENGKIAGEIYLDEENTLKMNVEKLRTKIGMVFQQPTAFPMSIEKNLSYILKYHTQLRGGALKEKIEFYLRRVGLWEEIGGNIKLYAEKLSGGQKQRLSIARCLCVEPEIILLDEPCSALDIKNTQAIESLLLELRENYTVVMVTHNLAQAKRLSDEIIFMHQGEIIEQSGSEQFFDCPKTQLAKEYIEYMN